MQTVASFRSFDRPVQVAVLNMLARRDAKLALEFLQLTRPLRQNDNSRDPGEEQQDKMMEMNLASQIAENDPKTALRIAEEYLDGKLDSSGPIALESRLSRVVLPAPVPPETTTVRRSRTAVTMSST